MNGELLRFGSGIFIQQRAYVPNEKQSSTKGTVKSTEALDARLDALRGSTKAAV